MELGDPPNKPLPASGVVAESPNPRLLAVAVLVTIWGVRLTWNFYRKGGYSLHGEDYRWPVIRSKIHPVLFQLFNLFFIAVYQVSMPVCDWGAGYILVAIDAMASVTPRAQQDSLGACWCPHFVWPLSSCRTCSSRPLWPLPMWHGSIAGGPAGLRGERRASLWPNMPTTERCRAVLPQHVVRASGRCSHCLDFLFPRLRVCGR